MASTRAPASALARSSGISASLALASLSLACATGASDGEETTFASFGSGNDELDEDTAADTGESSGTDSTNGDTTTASESDSTGETTTATTTATDTSDTSDTSSTDMPPDPCGNGSIDVGEECDGVDLGGQDCVSQGFDMGQLGCNDDCTFDLSACELIQEFCGDGIVNNGEQCEPGMLGNATCASSGFVYGTLGCNAQTCVYDTSGCQNVWIEDFEDGVVPPGWSGGGSANWSITTLDKHAGTYGGVSGDIADSQQSWAQVTVQFVQAGSISFWHKISSESGWDYGRFYLDGVQQNQWSGAGAWAQYSVNVAAGQHVLRFAYEKDGSISSNSDAWFVDDVTLTGGYVP